MRPLLDLYEGTKHIGWERVAMRLWDQKEIDWEKEKEGGGGDGIRVGDRYGRGGDTERSQWGERLKWGGME